MEPRRLVTEQPARSGKLGYRAFAPRAAGKRPMLVVVHGSSRRSGQQFRSFLPAAMEHEFAVVAPDFDDSRFSGYQRLAGASGSFAALEAWHELLDDLAVYPGLDTSRVDLFGFGGGAQFAHRAALMAPLRVHRLVVACAGWFTWLDPALSFPHGLATASDAPQPDVDAFLALPVLVLAGERDVQRDDTLRTSRRIDRRQGANRLLRALTWTDHLEEAARTHGMSTQARFDLLEGCRHSFRDTVASAGLVERVVDFLGQAPSPGLIKALP